MANYSDTKKYTSSYNIKDFALNVLGPKYFPQDVIEGYNIGLLGYSLDLFANTTEDIFNTIPIVLNEMFPNLAEMPTTIYNYASLFQESQLMAEAAVMDCILLLPMDSLIENADFNTDKSYRQFILDQRTKVLIEDYSFILDYDIRITLRPYKGDYIINASYVKDFKNSMNTLKSPYLKIQKLNYNGTKYLAILVKMRRCDKTIMDTRIIDNDKINSTTIQIEYPDQLANFEVYYRESTDNNYIQLQKKIINSKAITDPFCYYKLKDEHTLEISFTNRENFFKPKFNSELIIEYWTTNGEEGNFEKYLGYDVEVYRESSKYENNSKVPIIAIPQSASTGGKNRLTLYELRDKVADAFATVDSYTTEADLQRHFNWFNIEDDTRVTFIKKRDDIFDRLFTAFGISKNKYGSYYKTNTLTLKIYKEEFDHMFEQSQRLLLKPCNNFIYDGDSTTQMVKITDDALSEMKEKPEFIYNNPFLMTVSNNGVVGYYLNNINSKIPLDYNFVNNDSLIQFICNNLYIRRSVINDKEEYKFTLNLIATNNDIENPIIGNDGVETGRVKVIISFCSKGGNEIAFIECEKKQFDIKNLEYVFEGTIITDDYISQTESIRIRNLKNITDGSDLVAMIPMTDLKVNIYTFFNYVDSISSNKFSHIEGFENSTITNIYTTEEKKIELITPLNMLRSRMKWDKDDKGDPYLTIYDVPVIKKVENATNQDIEDFDRMITILNNQYDYMKEILDKKTNNYSVDMKFYNTYGRSNNFIIDEDNNVNRVNCSIYMQVYCELNSEAENIIRDMKIFIKKYFEDFNKDNNEGIFISNLIQQLENNFPYLRYVKFVSINGYPTEIQTIENNTKDINTLTKAERIRYVPEYLNIEEDDIILEILNK